MQRASHVFRGRVPGATALKVTLVWFLAILLVLGIFVFFNAMIARAASGPLTVEIGAAYNLVVDSNVSSPSTYAPAVATVMGRFCNTSTVDTLTGVWGHIGTFTSTVNNTPGIYPARNSSDASFQSQHPDLATGHVYSFTHIGGRAGFDDASRYVGDLAPGECKVQYWHFEYPRCENSEDPPCSGTPVWGDSVKPEDDLWLEFDIWATADGGWSADATRRMTMRNEISAMANKIEPNGNPPGAWFNTDTDTVEVGDIITSNGVRYNFGNVRHGFDNDGDFVPDFNAWAQPIGDPSYDPSCFRLIRTSGILTVSRGAGKPDMIINFSDQLYFMNLPPDNTGVDGNVYYTFLALDGPCNTNLTPYQEVASGFDNEKFNGDYGAGIPPVVSNEPDVTVDKSGNITVTPGARITYTLDFSNTGDGSAGLPLASAPLVFSDAVPANTTLMTDSLSSSVDVVILYSVDGGDTWTTTQPASGITHVQWWLTDTLGAHDGGLIEFAVEVDASPTTPFIENCADARFGNGAAFAEDCFSTLISGTNTIGDWVWRDEDSDGVQDGGEVGINDITVSLYWDANGDGELDSGDTLVLTTTTATSGTAGYYLFENLPDASYLVVVHEDDPDLPTGYRHTTDVVYATTLSDSDDFDADFGFGPSLRLEKAFVGDSAYEGDEVNYVLTVKNLRPCTGESVPGGCSYEVWAGSGQTAASPKNFTNDFDAYGASGPDDTYAYGDFSIGSNRWIEGINYDVGSSSGVITDVEIVLPAYLDNWSTADDELAVELFTGTTSLTSTVFTNAYLDNFVGVSNAGWITWTVTNDPPGGSWEWSDFANLTLRVNPKKVGGADDGILYLDAFGFRITTSGPCPVIDSDDVMATVPLTDTYDTTYLEFLSASPEQTSINEATGVISWSNVGPIYPGESKDVRVTFLAKELATATNVDNSAGVTGAEFRDGGLANDDYVTATGRITPTGSITGLVWSDVGTIGWAYQPGTDYPVSSVQVNLYACYDDSVDNDGVLVSSSNVGNNGNCEAQNGNKGEWRLMDTQLTSENGDYVFDGLLDAYYYVSVSTTTLPAYTSQSAEANFAANGSGFSCISPPGNNSCDHLWGDLSQDLNGTFNPIDNAEDITEVNFGYSMLAVIYGTIWEDDDGDGNRDIGDDGLDNATDGITVTLYASDGSVYTTTQTDENGYYEFSNLPADTYTVTVGIGTLPGGATWTQTAETGPDEDGTLDNEMTTTVTVGQVSGSHDFGYHRSGDTAVGDMLYYDWDGDGTQDSNEEGIPYITVFLYEDADGDGNVDAGVDGLISTTVTADGSEIYPAGYYTFTNLAGDDYVVVVDIADADFPDDVVQTQDPDVAGVCESCDRYGSADTTGGSVDDVDFGYQPFGTGAIGDTVWKDVNGDGVQSGATETGIPNVTVWLEVDLDGDGTYTRVATQTTDADGYYLFEDLPDADYRVVVDSDDADLPTDGFGYQYTPSTKTAITTTLSGGNTYLEADFGFKPLGAIGDTIYWDANENGDLDWNETGIENVEVTLVNVSVITTADGVRYDPGTYELTDTTTITGFYLFTGLPAGTYSVTVGSISGDPTLTGDPDTNGVSCTDPELDPFFVPYCDGETSKQLYVGTVFLGADFGYIPPGVIGDYVWRDLDNDGIQDGNEPGIPGVVVTVTNGTMQTTTTDFDGYYSFANLTDTTWVVTFQQPTNMTPTVTSVGAITSGVGSVGLGTSVVIGGGEITEIEGAACTDCSLYVDSGFVLDGNLYISGTVFYDASGMAETNDAFTAGDTPYANITVYLYDSSQTLIGQTTTDASGHYTFTNLINGVYTVSVNTSAPQLNNQQLSAVNTYELANYHTVGLSGVSVTDVDYGFYAQMDFGDLPDTYSLTHLADEGPYHITGTLYLGPDVTSESDGVESGTAEGDTDDGVVHDLINYWTPGSTVNLTVTVTGGSGYLIGWFDWTGDGDFNDANERVTFGSLAAGVHTLDLFLPSNYDEGRTLNARFRLYDGQPSTVSPTGSAVNGEVEDYQWEFGPNVITMQSFTASSVERVRLVVLGLALLALSAGVLVLRRRARRRV